MFRYFKFRLNDHVQFKENSSHTYRIVGYRLERSFYPDEDDTTIIYELYRQIDGISIDAEEEDLIPVSTKSEAYTRPVDVFSLMQPVKLTFIPKTLKPQVQPKPDMKKEVDLLLDQYNDYKILADFFHDMSYEMKMEEILEQLKELG